MDTQIFIELLAEQEKALAEFNKLADAILDRAIKTNELVDEVLKLQVKALLNQ